MITAKHNSTRTDYLFMLATTFLSSKGIQCMGVKLVKIFFSRVFYSTAQSFESNTQYVVIVTQARIHITLENKQNCIINYYLDCPQLFST